MSPRRRRVLVLSRAYPNSATELLGLWVQRLVARAADRYETKVIAPVPWCPPLPGLPEYYARFRRVPRRRWDGPVGVFHPRFVVGAGSTLRRLEWRTYHRAVIDPRHFSTYHELEAYLRSLGPGEIEAYREAARDFMASDAYRPFTKQAFAEILVTAVAEDLGISK